MNNIPYNIPMGQCALISFAMLDRLLDVWAKEYFGGAKASAACLVSTKADDDPVLTYFWGVELQGLRVEDELAVCRLYDKYHADEDDIYVIKRAFKRFADGDDISGAMLLHSPVSECVLLDAVRPAVNFEPRGYRVILDENCVFITERDFAEWDKAAYGCEKEAL